jgi:hypothetical protein
MREFNEQLSFIGLIDPHIVHRLIPPDEIFVEFPWGLQSNQNQISVGKVNQILKKSYKKN